MSQISATERRERLRAVLSRPVASSLASVFDATSARLAEAAGFEVGFMAGSVASATVLGAPDIVVLTLSEFADQAHRIGRGCDLPLMVDADDGYGNSLNVMRTVQEMETAGVAALTIEDTLQPRRYGVKGSELVSREEFRDKLRAALAARIDPSLVVIGRTGAMARAGVEETVARVRIIDELGMDAVTVTGVTKIEEVRAVHAVTNLPIIHNTLPDAPETLAALGVRLINHGHVPYFVALQSLYDSYRHIAGGGVATDLDALTTDEVRKIALREADYAEWTQSYLGLS